MCENPLETIEKLEKLAAWHRINAESAGADWVWEARLRTAEDLERRAAKLRALLTADWDKRRTIAKQIHDQRACRHSEGRSFATQPPPFPPPLAGKG